MTPTPHAELLTAAEVEALEIEWYGTDGSTGADLIRATERALLARLGEQQPVAWAVGLPGEPIKQQALWTTRPTDEDVRFATTQGGFPLPALVVTSLYAHPLAAQPVAQGEREAFEAWASRNFVQAPPTAIDFTQRPWSLMWLAWQASRSSAQGAAQVPPGMALVPLKPTPQMWRAWDKAPSNEDGDIERNHAWAAMLAAAPAAPHGEGER